MAKALKKGDKVSWSSPGGATTGRVIGQETSGAKEKADDPRYRVKSDKSGKEAVHKADALKKG